MEKTISKEEVISRLRDDGDFDKLRLKIIRRLKDNEELRKNIVSVVKQSAVLQRPGTETLRPREILDAIHEDVGDKLMSQLSERVLEIIRSEDGMKNEIKESIQSVYTRVLNPKGKEENTSSTHQGEENTSSTHQGEENTSSTHQGAISTFIEADNNGSAAALITNVDEIQHEKRIDEPPGFSLHEHGQDSCEEQYTEKSQLPIFHGKSFKEEQRAIYQEPKQMDTDIVDHKPRSSTRQKRRRADDSNDEDPDVPPGFG